MNSRAHLFEPGEKVMYPQFGLGTIAGVTSKEVNGSDLSFYRLEFPLKQMEILVPVKRASENGLRRVMTTTEVKQVLEYLSCAPPSAKPQQWHRWRKKTLEQLKSGDPLEIAKIFCYLHSLEGKKGLSFTERKILLQVERMLVSEIAVAKQISEDEAEHILAGRKKSAASNGRARSNGRAHAASNGNGNGHAAANGSARSANGRASANGRSNGTARASANGRASSNGNGSARARANGSGRVSANGSSRARSAGGNRRVLASRSHARANGKAAAH
jgi:CarD family transcriptional regulator, regulator of rRNA transcription